MKWIGRLLLFFFLSTILVAVAYKWVPVYLTPLMLLRAYEYKDDDDFHTHHTWVSYEEIPTNLVKAVISSEDGNFMHHNGIDYKAIEQAQIDNRTRKHPRGASTISQQTAKNVFLWPESSWLRKGMEVYFTFLIETIWGKKRIMEVYLNSIEMGKGIYGVEAVAEYHFNTTSSELSRSQCALIAASLPNPIKFNSAEPSNYMQKRKRWILKEMKFVNTIP